MNFSSVGTSPSSLSLPSTTKLELGGGFGITLMSTDKFLSGFNVDYVHTFDRTFRNRCYVASFMKILL